MQGGRKRWGFATGILGGVTFVLMMAALVLALVWAPREASMGDIQRLFYFHMPSAWIALGPAFTVVFGLSIAYLVTGKIVFDRWAAASAEIGVLFTTITLVTGPLWAKPVWGVYWTWEPRLTTTLVLWFIYVGYLLLRSIAGEGARRARLAAVYGIVGWIDVPIVFLSIWWWRSIHPQLLSGSGFAMDSSMFAALMVALAAFTLFYVYLLVLRARSLTMQEEITGLRARMRHRDRGGDGL
ncbi:MAG: cytochrome c biogenesis protein [bacterium]